MCQRTSVSLKVELNRTSSHTGHHGDVSRKASYEALTLQDACKSGLLLAALVSTFAMQTLRLIATMCATVSAGCYDYPEDGGHAQHHSTALDPVCFRHA